jgi:hypothetical protein
MNKQTLLLCLAVLVPLGLPSAIHPFGAIFGQTPTEVQTSKQTQASPPLFSLSVSLAESTSKAGSLLDLKIMKKNISTQDVGVIRIVGSAAPVYDITVTDTDGKPATETSIGRKLHGKEPMQHWHPHQSTQLVILKPGETLEEHIYLNDLYDFRPGTYSIQVSQTMYSSEVDEKAGLKSVIRSNSVTLTVTN